MEAKTFEELNAEEIKRRMDLGLSQQDAIECTKAQNAHDAQLAAEEAKAKEKKKQ